MFIQISKSVNYLSGMKPFLVVCNRKINKIYALIRFIWIVKI